MRSPEVLPRTLGALSGDGHPRRNWGGRIQSGIRKVEMVTGEPLMQAGIGKKAPTSRTNASHSYVGRM